MELERFLEWLGSIPAGDLARLIEGAAHDADDAGALVDHARATVSVRARLARGGRRRDACLAWQRAGEAVLAACARAGLLEQDRTGCTRLARAAADAAQAMACGDAGATRELLRPFRGELALV